MKIGWVGLGKLGMPCALTLAEGGHEVIGFDRHPAVAEAITSGHWPHQEEGVEWMLSRNLGQRFTTARQLEELASCEVVFVAVQTPHDPAYGGELPMPEERRPFDTTWLRRAVAALAVALDATGSEAAVVVVSTVLPGTCAREVEPLLGGRPFVYSPAFVAMGQVYDDLRNPEFVLGGARDPAHAKLLQYVFQPLVRGPLNLIITGVESAELAKMAYNTAITAKVVLANALMELAEATGADVDEVADVLQQATRRVSSGAYLRAGMGDGGPCHPRDNVALAWLADDVGISADPFAFFVRAREAQARWLAEKVAEEAYAYGLPIVIVGRAYKAGSAIESGSAALLVGHYLEEAGNRVRWFDPACGYPDPIEEPSAVLVAMPDRLPELPKGSIVIDPWGVLPAGDRMVRLGRT